jgi:hypothetical protein
MLIVGHMVSGNKTSTTATSVALSRHVQMRKRIDSSPMTRRWTCIALVALCLLTSAATAYAEGWYLLAPPWNDTNAPLMKWQQIGAFDTAQICEGSKLRILEGLEKRKEQLESSGDGSSADDPLQTEEGQEYLKLVAAAVRARASLCVSIGDPRLR